MSDIMFKACIKTVEKAHDEHGAFEFEPIVQGAAHVQHLLVGRPAIGCLC